MRALLTILSFFVYSISLAGRPDTAGLQKAVYQLNDALLQKDSVTLKRLLHEQARYGHSNGWIETKREVLDDLQDGKLIYNRINQSELAVVVENETACVRAKADIEVLLNGKPLTMSLHILQVWIKDKSGWVLLSRQSTKI